MDSTMEKKRIAIFASGRGSNAREILRYTQSKSCSYQVGAILSNNSEAGVFNIAKEYEIAHRSFLKKELYKSDTVLTYLFDKDIDLIVLAGFLLLIPQNLIDAYPSRIVNIHPALLPKYGGKGMYGHHVHTAVKEANEAESGISIHFVDEEYDKGNIIFQSKCKLEKNDTIEKIGQRVLVLEHHFYPQVVSGVVSKLN